MRQGIDLRDLDDHFEMEKRPSTAAPVGYMTGSGGGRGQRRHSPTYETYGGNARPSATYKDEGKTEFITGYTSVPIKTTHCYAVLQASAKRFCCGATEEAT